MVTNNSLGDMLKNLYIKDYVDELMRFRSYRPFNPTTYRVFFVEETEKLKTAKRKELQRAFKKVYEAGFAELFIPTKRPCFFVEEGTG